MLALIVNPASGGGGNAQLVAALREVAASRGEETRVYETRCEGDGEARARQALCEGCARVAVVGGDGSLSDAARALCGSGAEALLVPCGTGNDFARVLKLPKRPLDAFLAQLSGEKRALDLGEINGRPFVNVAGTGFDVEVLRRTEELKAKYPGKQAYRRALLSVLGRYDAPEIELSLDGGPFERLRVTIVEFANGQYIGGGMRVAPDADAGDGLLDVVTVRRVSAGAIPLLLPLFIGGLHTRLPVARMRRAKEAVVRRKGMTVNIDGRLERMDEARFRALPGALTVRVP